MTDLVALARDPEQTARVIVTARHSTYVRRDVFETWVFHDDLLWMRCMHGHTSEQAAAKCVRKVALRWEAARKADEVDLVNSGTTVEWRWVTGRTAAGTPLGTSARCRPETPANAMTLSDYGPVTGLLASAPRTGR